MRKHGPEAFTIEIIASGLTETDAKVLEIAHIDLFQTRDRRFGYNVSPGGDYDCIAASQASRDAVAADPAAFLAKLTAGIRRSFASPERLARHAAMVSAVWAARDVSCKETICQKISAAQKTHHANLSADDLAAKSAQLAKARAGIDQDKRKARQREAVQSYWTPERRAAKAEFSRAKRAAELARRI
jgi:hypothetical protein